MWHCVISGGVIARQSARNCFKYYNLWYAVRFAWCHWGKISKFNIFHFLPASAVSVSDNFSSPHGDSRWEHGKWLEVTVTSMSTNVTHNGCNLLYAGIQVAKHNNMNHNFYISHVPNERKPRPEMSCITSWKCQTHLVRVANREAKQSSTYCLKDLPKPMVMNLLFGRRFHQPSRVDHIHIQVVFALQIIRLLARA